MKKFFTLLFLVTSVSVFCQKNTIYYNTEPQSIKVAKDNFKKENQKNSINPSSLICLSTGLILTGTSIYLKENNKISNSNSSIMLSTGIILSFSGVILSINNN